MMREILFRGIPKSDCERHFFADIWKNNCEGSFVYGSLIISKGRYFICVSALCKINSCINNGMTSMIEVIPETVGQFTGLTDKNGNKIFEGDIVKYTEFYKFSDDEDLESAEEKNKTTSVVKLVNGRFTPLPTRRNCEDYWYSYAMDDFEVIGNIHDNPELLKGVYEE